MGNEIVTIESEMVAKHSISDLILPLVGYHVKVPDNLKSYLDGILSKHGITMDSFDHKNHEFKLGGTYRRVFVKLDKLEYDFVQYRAEGKPELQSADGVWKTLEETVNHDSCALRVKITLPSSSYATVAVRELLHSSDVTKSFN